MVRTLIEEENMPVVKNIRDCEAGIKNPNDVYIGRGSKWGNPLELVYTVLENKLYIDMFFTLAQGQI